MPNTNTNEQQRKLRSAEKSSISLAPRSESPATMLSSAKLWNKIESRFEELTKSITASVVSQLKTEFDSMFTTVLERMSAMESDFNTKLKLLERDFKERCTSFNTMVLNCQSSIDAVESHCTNIDALQNEFSMVRAQQFKSDNSQLKSQIDALARKNISGDLVLHGIPMTADENLNEIFKKFCATINVNSATPNFILRTKPLRNSTSSAVIVKLPHAQMKTHVLRKAAEYYKNNSKSVTLSDLGFTSTRFVRVYESLTKLNHALFRRANELRRNKCLHSVFTRSGRVYVKEAADKPPICIVDMLSLDSFRSDGECIMSDAYNDPAVAVNVEADSN